MQARALTFAALASGVFTIGAQTPPAATHYRIQQVTDQEVDLTAAGQGKQQKHSASSLFVSLTLTDSAAGRVAHFVVDSAVGDSTTAPESKAVLDSLRGQAFHAYLEKGKVSSIKALREGQPTSTASALILALTPRVQRDTKVGAAWTDTTDVTNDIPNGNMTIRTVTNWKASGNETREGTRALKVDAASSSAMTGEQAGAKLEGTGTATATYYIAADGRLVSGSSSSNSTLAITTPQLPDPIPLTLKSSLTITLLR
ncbi:MAG TPA: hypothetical protein VJ847_01575 [Gemmatimonadales bacterium]|jgi:hypothetical protein|nr:hypothetical protein [Gemmatimonadales bacterium]